jgi:hypothetical protein
MDPWATDGTSRLAQIQYEQSQPKPPIEVGGRLIDPKTYQPVYEPPPEPEKPQVVPRESSLYQNGEWISPPAGGSEAIDPDRQDRISAAVNSTYHKERLDVTMPILNSMEQSIDDPRATADLNFIYGPAKILDPEGSVRDQDAAAMSMAQSLPKAWQGQVLQALAGKGKLSREVRIGLYELARSRVEQFHKGAADMRDYYSSTAPGYATPPIPAMSKWQDQNMQAPSQQAAPMQQAPDAEGWIKLPNGNRIRQVR